MRFRWSKASTENVEKAQQAEQALAEAEAAHCRVRRRGHEVSRVAKSLRDFRERNHISEQLQVIMEGHR